MTEEEYFRKNYPDSCYGDRPLSPYWDFFQDGVKFGERQSEKENADRKDQLIKAKELLNSCIFKARGNVNPSWSELITDIEQFLREIEQDLNEGCPDTLCEDCTKEDCTVRKLGLVSNKDIEK